MEDGDPTTGNEEHVRLIHETLDALRIAEGTDQELLEILAKDIVKLHPAATAVPDAVAAVEALAKKRAESE